ncbi:hypothetical protein BH20ACT2_BH20ACT2_09510 [soil metagenome]
MVDKRAARDTGAGAVAALRRTVAERAADLIRRDPERAATAVEVGLIDRDWLAAPGDHPVSSASPSEVVQRFLERSVEQRPSVLGTLGLNALELLAWEVERDAVGGTATAVTIVFIDLEGFTRFTADEGDAAALRLLNEHNRIAGPVVRGRGGRIVKHLGDGLMLTFPSPDAGVHAALELVELPPAPLRLRAGVHLGEAVVTRTDVIGHVVNVAARVTGSARGGQALATVAARDAVGELRDVRFGRARHRSLKGLDGRVSVCSIERTEP